MHHFVSKSKSVMLDTNLLTVYLVAQLGHGSIEKFKRTRAYTSKDAEILDSTLIGFKSIVTTPHVLAETANLIDWFKGDKRGVLFNFLIAYIDVVNEVYEPAKNIIQSPAFFKLGLSDASLFDICYEHNCVLLTDNLDLYGFASGHGIEAMNFNHLKTYL